MSSDQEIFAQLPRKSIKKMAECAHFYNLPVDVLGVLAEDSNYRLRETIKNAVQFMNHSRRKKLTVSDFNKATQGADNEPLLGYLNTEPLIFDECEYKETFVIENKNINFMEKAFAKTEGDIFSKYCLKGSWLSVGNSMPGINILSDDLKEYFCVVLAGIFGNEKKLCTLALSDLKSNPNISPLVPIFTEFISSEIKRCHDLTWLRKILLTVKALNANPNLFLGHESILKELINSLLHCTTTFTTVSVDAEWVIRDTSAQLLSGLLKKWTMTFDDVYATTLSELKRIFENSEKELYSHYGVIVTALAIGVPAIEEVILPHLPNYWPHLNAALASIEKQRKSEAIQVHGMLLITCELYLRSELKKQFDVPETDVVKSLTTEGNASPSNQLTQQAPEPMDVTLESSSSVSHYSGNTNWDKFVTALFPVSLNSGKKTILEIYQDFYEQFGDALCLSHPYLNVRSWYKSKAENISSMQLHSCPELHMTDEELLQQFNEKKDDNKDSNLLQQFKENKDDDKEQFKENKDDDKHSYLRSFRIKRTVTDPQLGVKLTIAKIPKGNLERDELLKSASVSEPSLLTKDGLKHKKVFKDPEPIFEAVSRIQQFPTINFNFNGSTPRPISKLKRKYSTASNASSETSQLHKISLKLEHVCKRKSSGKTKSIYNKRVFLSGNLKNNL